MAAAASLLPVVVVVDASSSFGRPPTATTRGATPRTATRDDGRRRRQAGGAAPSPPLFSPRGGGGGGGGGDDGGGNDAAASADGGGPGGGKNVADGASFEITMDRDGGGKVKVDVATANGGGGGIGDMIDAARERYAASSSSSAAALTALSTAAGGRRGGGASTSTSSSSSMSSSSSHISSRFPVSPSELPHFMSMSFMMFLFIYVFTTVRDTKDTLVVSNCGAEAIPFLKLYGVMPCATAFIVAYSKLSDVLDKKVLFYVTLVPFFVFYVVFAFVLFPNRDALHFVPSGDGGVGATSAAMNLLRYWSFSLYFVVSELWASAGVPLLFWQVSRREAKTICNIARGVNASPHLHFASVLSTILKVLPEDGMKRIVFSATQSLPLP